MATMTTAARITQILFHHHKNHPLFTTTRKPLSLPLLGTQIPRTSLFSSYSKPLFCSIKEETVQLEENEEIPERKVVVLKEREVPKLSVKEKKEICSYANGLGDKLKSQQVGKSGVTQNSVFAFDETLEANELLKARGSDEITEAMRFPKVTPHRLRSRASLFHASRLGKMIYMRSPKLKIHRTCPGELEDVVDQLERATGSVVVGQIGRTVIFYRPSITKLNAEKKKEQARKLYAQKREKAQSAFMKREQVPRRTGRGQFSSRRSEKIAS